MNLGLLDLSKSSIFIKKVVIFKLFVIFVSDLVFDFLGVDFWPFGTLPGGHLGASWGPPLREALIPRCPQNAPKGPEDGPQEPKPKDRQNATGSPQDTLQI